MRLSARTLATFDPAELWEILTGRFVLVFDDGEMEVDWRSTIYSAYAWEFHRRYPNTPMLKRHHAKTLLDRGRLHSGTHLELLGNVMNDTLDTYMQDPSVSRDALWELVYRTTNVMYNVLIHKLEEYVVSLDITDFMNVLKHPKIIEQRKKLQPTSESIKETYKVYTDVLLNGVDLPRNPIALAAQSKTANLQQILQCVSPLGFGTDTDQWVFQTPIMRGYAQGLRAIYDSAVESRKAAMALTQAKSPLQDVEYFSRRMQLMDQTVQNLHMEDCGATEYLHWHVKGELYDENHVKIFGGDLQFIEGKYYLDETTQTLKVIKRSDKHLIGKTIKMRSVLHCAHRDPYGVCATCFGELSLSVPEQTNLGQICCTTMAQEVTQGVLSTKHLIGSASIDRIIIKPEQADFLKSSQDGNSYLLADSLRKKRVTMVIGRGFAPALTDILDVKQIEDLNIVNVSAMTEIGFKIHEGEISNLFGVKVGMSGRDASLTYPMLAYIRRMGWIPNEKGNYEVDMSEWDWSKPVLTLPLVHFSMSDHSKDMAEMLESSVKEMATRDTNVTPDAFLAEFYMLVNKRLSVNLAVLEVIVYATTIVSAENDDYQLPKPWTTREMGVMEYTMDNRSLAPAMAYEGHYDNFVEPSSYTKTNRPDSPMDGVLMPAELYN